MQRSASISVDPRRRASLGPRARSRGADVAGTGAAAAGGVGAPEGYKARQSIGGEGDVGGGGTATIMAYQSFNAMLDEQFDRSVHPAVAATDCCCCGIGFATVDAPADLTTAVHHGA